MRKNSIRKLIHGILDLLPLFVIPIFAININQKSVEPISITVKESWSEPKYLSNEVNSNDDLIVGNIYKLNLNGLVSTQTTTRLYFSEILAVNLSTQGTTIANSNQTAIDNTPYYYIGTDRTRLFYAIETNVAWAYESPTGYAIVVYKDIEISNYDYSTFLEYTDYNEIIYHNEEPVLYDDTDIGSQFLYSLYISTDNYFNMNNVFNLNSVYSWFEMNIFGGSAPLSIYIVWNIIIYELVMDLLMLLYALFMFFIDACQKLIDKPLESIK